MPGLAITAICLPLNAASVEIRVDCDKPTVPLSPHLYGLFFEDINFGADGGLYAELVQNRSFEYYKVPGRPGGDLHPLFAWEKVERGGASRELVVTDAHPLNDKNTKYLEIKIDQAGDAAAVRNSGYDGMSPSQHGR